jgi:signal transduction histidine kinase/CheY-like chemotaxis protein
MINPDKSTLSNIINSMNIMWAYIDRSRHYQGLSLTLAEYLQIDPLSFVNKKASDIISEGSLERLSPIWDRVLLGETITLKEYLTYKGLGRRFIHLVYIPDIKDGIVVGFYECFHDNTEQDRTIEILLGLHSYTSDTSLSSTERVNGLLTLGHTAFSLPLALISRIDGEEYIVKYSSTPSREFSPGDSFKVSSTYCTHTLKADGPVAFNHAGASEIKNHSCYIKFGLESYIGTPLIVNGSRYGTLSFSGPEITVDKFSDNDFNLIQLLAQWIGNELSRNSVEKSLNRQIKLLEAMSQQARIGAWELDLVKNKVYWSTITRTIHEVPDDFIPDLENSVYFYKEGYSRDRISEIVNLSIESGDAWHEELQLVTAKGNEIWVAATGNVEMVNGTSVRLFGSFQDIDDRIKTELELKLEKEKAELAAITKSAFLANMSHEIRTPMNGVIGMLNVLKNSVLTDDQLHHVNLASSSGESLLNIINDILDFTKIEAVKLHLESIDFDLLSMIGNFTKTMAFSAQEKGLELILDYNNLNLNFVKGDSGRLSQILTNLVGNAIKFTHDGSIIITVSDHPHETDPKKCLLKFTVEDTGIGIEQKKQINLFEKFTQADDSTTREYGGTGLGLSIARQICQLMNGDISILSEVGKGSVFSCTVEIEKSDKNTGFISNLTSENDEVILFSENKKIRDIGYNQFKRLGIDKIQCMSLNEIENPCLYITDTTGFLIVDIPIKFLIDLDKLTAVIEHANEKNCTVVVLSEVSHSEALKYQFKDKICTIIPKPVTPYELVKFIAQYKKDPSRLLNIFLTARKHDDFTKPKLLAKNRPSKILLVEDNMINQEVAKGLLQSIGYTADIAINGRAALELLKDNQTDIYDVILMDCQMPEMDGYQATQCIRFGEAGDTYIHVPIIALTANAMKGDRQKCIDAGMNDYLSKPIDPSKLEAKLTQYLFKG